MTIIIIIQQKQLKITTNKQSHSIQYQKLYPKFVRNMGTYILYCISFKLETYDNLLLTKCINEINVYGVHDVIGNILDSLYMKGFGLLKRNKNIKKYKIIINQ